MTSLIGHSLGRYTILEQLGEGGMASVYKAYDTRLERDVAVKVLRIERLAGEDRQRSLKRFEREAAAMAHLSHPNIVRVLDYGLEADLPYLVMELMPGGTLRGRLGAPIYTPWASSCTKCPFCHQETTVKEWKCELCGSSLQTAALVMKRAKKP